MVLSALLGGCFQPRTSAEEFGTGGASTVVGDQPTDAVDPGANLAGDQQDAAQPLLNDTKPAQTDAGPKASVPGDAGSPMSPVPVDAGQPVPGPVATSPTTLSFSVQTGTLGGNYSPKNVYAIWVVDAQGKFVKTLAKFARARATYLTGWNAASRGNVVDAVTGATMSGHGQRTVSWNLTDVSQQTVADGDYQIVAEITDANRTGRTVSVAFRKGPAPVRVTPPDAPSFSNMELVLE